MPRYNHAFSLGFACPDSEYENPDDALIHEKDKIIGSLLARVQELVTNTAEFRQACEPFDTFDQDEPSPVWETCEVCGQEYEGGGWGDNGRCRSHRS